MHDIRPFIPELFFVSGSLLYVGARVDAHSWLDELYEVGHQITVLEVWQPNIEGLATDNRIKNLVQGNVRDVRSIFMNGFDYVFWWHGPEHLDKNDLMPTLQDLESKAKKLIALACPYGVYHQGPHAGNPYEIHQVSLYPIFFKGLGYQVQTDGEPDQAGSEIVAWKSM